MASIRIAYCFSGTVGGLTGKAAEKTSGMDVVISTAANSMFRNIDCSNIDFFIHTWDTQYKEQIESTYHPKKMIAEEQVIFDIPQHLPNNLRSQAHYSRWYSGKKLIKLKSDYELEHGFKYDLVVVTRLDLYWLRPFTFNNIDPTKFNADQSIVNGKLYGSIDSVEMGDRMFVSNSEYMNLFYDTMYDKLNEYTLPGQCPQWRSISSHFLVVWHLKKLGLWNMVQFPYVFWWPSYNNPIEESDFTIVRVMKDKLNL